MLTGSRGGPGRAGRGSEQRRLGSVRTRLSRTHEYEKYGVSVSGGARGGGGWLCVFACDSSLHCLKRTQGERIVAGTRVPFWQIFRHVFRRFELLFCVSFMLVLIFIFTFISWAQIMFFFFHDALFFLCPSRFALLFFPFCSWYFISCSEGNRPQFCRKEEGMEGGGGRGGLDLCSLCFFCFSLSI